MDIKKSIDEKILDLDSKFRNSLKGDSIESGQLWARLNELKDMKKKFTDKKGNWII